MSSQNTRQNIYQQKIDSLTGDVNGLRLQLGRIEGRINEIDDTLARLPNRISAIRKMNYKIQTNLERDQSAATTRWAEINPSIRAEATSRGSTIKNELVALEREIQARRLNASYDLSSLAGVDGRLNIARSNVYDYSSRIERDMAPLTGIMSPLLQNVSDAEGVVKLTSAASFQWMEGETPVVATRAKDMEEKTEGVLTLTNFRIVYESMREIALKKTLFIVTEKKVERTPKITKPIGAVKSITKGNVGLLAGAGLYIEFKDEENGLKLDTKSEEADQVVRLHSLITSGQVDEELRGLAPTEKMKPLKTIISCPRCGAPYSDEIYRGQKTVHCKYCSTVITVD